MWCVDGARPATAGGFLEAAVDEALAHERIEVEADRVGVDAESFGELGDPQRSIGGSQGFEYRSAVRLRTVVLDACGHGDQLA
jgi:hypothetical protein